MSDIGINIFHQFRKLILFTYIFSFESGLPFNSAKMILIVTFLFILSRFLVTRKFIVTCSSGVIKSVFLGTLSVLAMSLVFQLVHGTKDFSLPLRIFNCIC